MKLKGKCKKHFGIWFTTKFCQEVEYFEQVIELEQFMNGRFHNSFRFGVIQDFFDSVGLCLDVSKLATINEYYYMIDDSSDDIQSFKSRKKARKAGVNAAVKKYNKRK